MGQGKSEGKRGKKDILSPQQLRLIEALLSGLRKGEACRKAKVYPQRYSDWMKKPIFAEALRKGQEDHLRAAAIRIRGATSIAVDALVDIARNPKADPKHRLTAARDLLDRAGLPKVKRHEHSGPDGAPVQVASTVTLEYLLKAIDAHAAEAEPDGS